MLKSWVLKSCIVPHIIPKEMVALRELLKLSRQSLDPCSMLEDYLSENGIVINEAVLVGNDITNKSSQFFPYQVIYGINGRLPIDI